MNDFWLFIPITLLVILLVPTILELIRRKDRGPREIPDITTFEAKTELDSVGGLVIANALPVDKRETNVVISDGAILYLNLVVDGDLKIGKKCHVYGSLKTSGRTEIGASSIVDGSILSRGEVMVKRSCRIGGAIISTQNITLGDNVIAEAVTTEKTVKLGTHVKINKRIWCTTIVSRNREA